VKPGDATRADEVSGEPCARSSSTYQFISALNCALERDECDGSGEPHFLARLCS
jgi:hypothetical protein